MTDLKSLFSASACCIITVMLCFTGIVCSESSPLSSEERRALPSKDNEAIPPPTDYIHRPILEFFTGLSCPSCMSGPHPDVERLWDENADDPAQPFTYVAFHELNGGGVDDLATEESRDRMRHYQPGVSGTPDAEFDGGYIELGGLYGGTLNYNTAANAIDDSSQRYEQNTNPVHPLQSLRTDFKYVELFVDQIYIGDAIAINVQVRYLGSSAIMPFGQLRGSLYVFMVEDGVEAVSTVEDKVVNNRNVFRGYAIEGQDFTISDGDRYTTTVEWDIPDAKIPIRPGNITAVAAVYDIDDTSSEEGNQGNIAQVPRCIQSATPASTAYDRENDLPVISNIEVNYDGALEVRARLDDSDGISLAYVHYNFEAANATSWDYVEMNLTGEEICDDNGVCYAYGNSTSTGNMEMEEGKTIYYFITAYDGSGVEYGGLGAGSKTPVYGYTASGVRDKATGDRRFSIKTVWWALGICLVIILVSLFVFLGIRARKMKAASKTKKYQQFG